MKRAYTFLMIALTFISFLYLTSAESDDPVPDPATWMPDANLRTAVRGILDLSDDEVLTKDDMQYLIVLDAPSRNIESLKGLQYATNLAKLKAPDNNISFVPTLNHMDRLTTIRLSNNPLSDSAFNFLFISEAPNLKRLAIRNTGMTDANPLLTPRKLYWLRVSGNDLTNASVLSDHPSLTNVDIEIPAPTDTTPPTVDVALDTYQTDDPHNFRVVVEFSEPIVGFTETDIEISSDVPVTRGHTTTALNRKKIWLRFEVSPNDLPCTVNLHMPAGQVQDDAENDNTVSNTLAVNLSHSESD